MSDVLGTDIAQSNGDWQVTAQADVATVSDTDNLQQALQRRWGTRVGSLFYDPTYGNPLIDIVSVPITQDWLDQAATAAKNCFLGDPRVADAQVTVTPNAANRTVLFVIQWTAINGATGTVAQEVPTGV